MDSSPLDRARRAVRRSFHDDAGLEVVEYALISALILVVLAVMIPGFPNSMVSAYDAIYTAIITALGG